MTTQELIAKAEALDTSVQTAATQEGREAIQRAAADAWQAVCNAEYGARA